MKYQQNQVITPGATEHSLAAKRGSPAESPRISWPQLRIGERKQKRVENAMLTRIAGTLLLSTIVFVVVTLLVSLGVLWATGGVARGALIGVISGAAAAFAIGAVGTAVGRSGERSRDESDRSGGGGGR